MNKLRQRTLMREVVFITIYQLDYGIDMADLRAFLRRESIRAGLDSENRDRAVKYFDDIAMLRDSIDEVVKIHLDNWDFHRLSSIDRNVMRLGAYELIYVGDVPVEVTLDESVEIAKKFGTGRGGRFVNGVLNRIATENVPAVKRNL